MSEQRESETQRLAGGELCLDFANTVNGHARISRHEYLQDYRDIVLWGGHTSILKSNEADEYLKEALTDVTEAEGVYRRGLELRETIFRIFSAVAKGNLPDEEDLQRLNLTWQEGMGHSQLAQSEGGFVLGWDDEPCLERPLRAVTASAIGLLTSQQVRQVRKCAGEGCDWLFVDTSRNHLRRWCSMEECGNRAKMRRRKIKLELSVKLEKQIN